MSTLNLILPDGQPASFTTKPPKVIDGGNPFSGKVYNVIEFRGDISADIFRGLEEWADNHTDAVVDADLDGKPVKLNVVGISSGSRPRRNNMRAVYAEFMVVG